MGEAPCLRCLSPSQLEIALALVWATIAGYNLPADLGTLIKDATCIDCNITSESKRLRAEITVMANQVGPISLPDALPDFWKCMECLTPSQIQSIILLSKCKYWGTELPL